MEISSTSGAGPGIIPAASGPRAGESAVCPACRYPTRGGIISAAALGRAQLKNQLHPCILKPQVQCWAGVRQVWPGPFPRPLAGRTGCSWGFVSWCPLGPQVRCCRALGVGASETPALGSQAALPALSLSVSACLSCCAHSF